MSKWDELTPAAINQVIFDIRAGEADPGDARRILEHFCGLVCRGSSVSRELLTHLADSLRDYLTGERTLEAALGLARGKRGRRTSVEANDHRVYSIAQDVLLYLLKGKSLEIAAVNVSRSRHLGESQVREYWRLHKHEALVLLRWSRKRDGYPWSQSELLRIEKIYRKQIRTGNEERDTREGRWLVLRADLQGKPFSTPGKSRKRPA